VTRKLNRLKEKSLDKKHHPRDASDEDQEFQAYLQSLIVETLPYDEAKAVAKEREAAPPSTPSSVLRSKVLSLTQVKGLRV